MKTHTERLVKRLRENKENPLVCGVAADELLAKDAEIYQLRCDFESVWDDQRIVDENKDA